LLNPRNAAFLQWFMTDHLVYEATPCLYKHQKRWLHRGNNVHGVAWHRLQHICRISLQYGKQIDAVCPLFILRTYILMNVYCTQYEKHTYINIYMHTYIHTYVAHIHTYITYTYTYIRTYIHKYIAYIHTLRTHKHTYIHTYITYTYAYIYYVHICIHILRTHILRTHILRTHKHTHTYIHYVHIYYVHIYIHTYIIHT
jgi:hypothetical protein